MKHSYLLQNKGFVFLSFKVMAFLCLTVSGCGTDPCGRPMSEHTKAPHVTQFSLFEQLKDDPWTMVMKVAFKDKDGDLFGGQLAIYLNDKLSDDSIVPGDLMLQSGLTTNDTSGDFALPIRFGESVTDGSTVSLGIQLTDEAGHVGNCYALELSFDVKGNTQIQ